MVYSHNTIVYLSIIYFKYGNPSLYVFEKHVLTKIMAGMEATIINKVKVNRI